MARVHHADSRYVATYMKYIKEFCVMFKEQCMFIGLDDKAIVPVGEPGIPISTGVRGHNKVLAPSDGPMLVATDHDFHLCGIVPSVTLVTDIPEVACDSFFKGKIYVTTKDKVFQPSSPYRHSAELIRLLRQQYSENDVDLQLPILCLMTDGGPDHRLTYETVKECLVELFMHLDLDMLISIRTAPNNSWMNPAERCMSILNLALQHVALSRDKMYDAFENMVKHKSSLNAVRNLASIKTDLKPAFQTSIEKVIDIVNDRFSRMSLKEEKLTVFKGLDDETVEGALNIVRVGLNIPDEVPLTTTSKTKDIPKIKLVQDFIEKHGYSSHYCFELMKCRNQADACSYCLLNPVRNQTVFDSLHFLPEPTPDQSGEHYKPFDQVYGNPPTIDAHRPSTKNTTTFDDADIDHDKLNREVFKPGKVRAAIKCGECNKTDRKQDALLRRISEQNTYTCGEDIFTDEGLFMKLAVSCISEVEISYYSGAAKNILPPVCTYCGSEDDLLNDYDEYVVKLLESYSVIRPLCTSCRRIGKQAKTWGRTFFKNK